MYHNRRTFNSTVSRNKLTPIKLRIQLRLYQQKEQQAFIWHFVGSLEFGNCPLVMVMVSKDVLLSACKHSGLAHGGLMDSYFRFCGVLAGAMWCINTPAYEDTERWTGLQLQRLYKDSGEENYPLWWEIVPVNPVPRQSTSQVCLRMELNGVCL